MKFVTRLASNKLMVSLVISHLDDANALLLRGLPKCSIDQLQLVQNIAAKIVLGKCRYDCSTRCLAELYWLPIQQRIAFKITLVHKSLHGLALQYLVNLLTRKVQRREGLCSNNKTSQLEIPSTTRKMFAARAFSVLGPQLWNKLSDNLQKIDSYVSFKQNLKTLLYRRAFSGLADLVS